LAATSTVKPCHHEFDLEVCKKFITANDQNEVSIGLLLLNFKAPGCNPDKTCYSLLTLHKITKL